LARINFQDKFAGGCVLPIKATFPQLPGFIFIVCFWVGNRVGNFVVKNKKDVDANLSPCFYGAPGKIRTCDFQLRRLTLYPLSYGRKKVGHMMNRVLKNSASHCDPALCGFWKCSHIDEYAALSKTPHALADVLTPIFQHSVNGSARRSQALKSPGVSG
jgi:hypothetical protein